MNRRTKETQSNAGINSALQGGGTGRTHQNARVYTKQCQATIKVV